MAGWRFALLCVFQSVSVSDQINEPHPLREQQHTVNPKTGRTESVFVNLEAIYPDPSGPTAVEFCFEELRARHRGWLDIDWAAERKASKKKSPSKRSPLAASSAPRKPLAESASPIPFKDAQVSEGREQARQRPQTVPLNDAIPDDAQNDENAPPSQNDENTPPSQAEIEKAKLAKKQRREERANRTRKIKVMEVREVRGETQTSMSIAWTNSILHAGSADALQFKRTSIRPRGRR